jgi:hypothetical protein
MAKTATIAFGDKTVGYDEPPGVLGLRNAELVGDFMFCSGCGGLGEVKGGVCGICHGQGQVYQVIEVVFRGNGITK